MADRYGRKPLLVFSLVLYALAGASGFLAESIGQLLVGRVLLGLAVAGTMTASSALIADNFQGPNRTRFVSLQSAFTGFGGVVFLPLGGLLGGLHWHAPFLLYLASLLIVPFAVAGIQEPQPQLSSAAKEPLPSRVWPLYLLAIAGMVVFYVGPSNGPFRLQNDFGLTSGQTGLLVAFLPLINGLTALQYGKIRARLGFQQIAGLGYTLLGLGWILTGIAPNLVVVFLGFVLVGLGAGLNNPNLSVWLMGLSTPQNRGRVMGGLSGAIFFGQFLSPLLIQPLLGFSLGTAFWVVGVVSMVLGLSLALSSRGLR